MSKSIKDQLQEQGKERTENGSPSFGVGTVADHQEEVERARKIVSGFTNYVENDLPKEVRSWTGERYTQEGKRYPISEEATLADQNLNRLLSGDIGEGLSKVQKDQAAKMSLRYFVEKACQAVAPNTAEIRKMVKEDFVPLGILREPSSSKDKDKRYSFSMKKGEVFFSNLPPEHSRFISALRDKWSKACQANTERNEKDRIAIEYHAAEAGATTMTDFLEEKTAAAIVDVPWGSHETRDGTKIKDFPGTILVSREENGNVIAREAIGRLSRKFASLINPVQISRDEPPQRAIPFDFIRKMAENDGDSEINFRSFDPKTRDGEMRREYFADMAKYVGSLQRGIPHTLKEEKRQAEREVFEEFKAKATTTAKELLIDEDVVGIAVIFTADIDETKRRRFALFERKKKNGEVVFVESLPRDKEFWDVLEPDEIKKRLEEVRKNFQENSSRDKQTSGEETTGKKPTAKKKTAKKKTARAKEAS